MFKAAISKLANAVAVIISIIALSILAGCANKPIIETKVIEKPVPVHCHVETPPECKDAYAVDRVSAKDDPVVINRALRTEIEERWSCEIKLRAAVRGCNSVK